MMGMHTANTSGNPSSRFSSCIDTFVYHKFRRIKKNSITGMRQKTRNFAQENRDTVRLSDLSQSLISESTVPKKLKLISER